MYRLRVSYTYSDGLINSTDRGLQTPQTSRWNSLMCIIPVPAQYTTYAPTCRPNQPVPLTFCTASWPKPKTSVITFVNAHTIWRYLKRVKVAHTRLQSVWFRSWSRFLAISLQVMWVINPAVGCHYFPPGPQLPPQPLRGLLPILLLGEQRYNGCEQFA